MVSFQELIHRLTTYWESRDCVIHHGHDLEVGAGTFNPATFLRCLGPEPYRTAYVEPSRRPSDGRYGENPNRVQLFHQFQVLIKPSPPDIVSTYLASLEAIGLDLKRHDIRFVHDDWESPTLGAWGLGWEVWLDGMEITQFTYFQVVGSLPLKPVCAEITYGLERLAMHLQNVDSLFDVKWNRTLTLRDISHRSEVEWSAYNFTLASTKMWLRHFDDYEEEAKSLIAKNLPIPAYDFIIKASHAFNMLEARGILSVTERTGYITSLRELSRLIATEYLRSREQLGFPLLTPQKSHRTPKLPAISSVFDPARTRDLLVEIGAEPLPALFLPTGRAGLEKAVRDHLNAHALHYEKVTSYATPQRLAVIVHGLVEGCLPQTLVKRGPSLSVAFDDGGQLTPQGFGFLRSIGLPTTTLAEVQQGKVEALEIQQAHLYGKSTQPGICTLQLLAHTLPSLIAHLPFPKKMRWGDLDISYARPIRWITALFGNQVIPFQVGQVRSGRRTFGHAQRAARWISLRSPKEYAAKLKKAFVLADVEERKQRILKQLHALERKNQADALAREQVLAQVLYLTEWPELLCGSFSSAFLKVPAEVLISEMVEHQKYFPLADRKGKLLNQFVITADNKPSPLIRKGNQKVLSARLSDGAFLYEQDVRIPLEAFNEKLKEMTFQKELGSMLDKVMRLGSHVQKLNRYLGIADQTKLLRASLLCKADLASSMCGEFPNLQGLIGRCYALAQKEDGEVARAIEEHWWPVSEHSALPKSPISILLSLADKMDNLLAYFRIGLKPTSSSDPYALRRQTIGIVRILVENKLSLNLRQLLEACQGPFPAPLDEILSFLTQRAKGVFEEYGYKKGEIEASLRGLCIDPYDQFCRVEALHAFRQSDRGFAQLFEVYKRAKGQLHTPSTTPLNPKLAVEPAERAILNALDLMNKHWKEALADRNYLKALHMLAELQPHIAHLFDTVTILVDEPTLRANRIALLQHIFSHFEALLDVSALSQVP